MKGFGGALILTTALAACGPVNMYYRPGVDVGRLNADQTLCEVQALKDAPVANQIRQRPPVYIPGPHRCDSAGNCVRYPGHWVSGGFYTVDVNADLRRRVQDMCMAQKGYEPVSLPVCPQSVERAAPRQSTRRLPQLTETSCIIRYDDGAWQIVNPVRPTASQ